jgi:hypothetical protein
MQSALSAVRSFRRKVAQRGIFRSEATVQSSNLGYFGAVSRRNARAASRWVGGAHGNWYLGKSTAAVAEGQVHSLNDELPRDHDVIGATKNRAETYVAIHAFNAPLTRKLESCGTIDRLFQTRRSFRIRLKASLVFQLHGIPIRSIPSRFRSTTRLFPSMISDDWRTVAGPHVRPAEIRR